MGRGRLVSWTPKSPRFNACSPSFTGYIKRAACGTAGHVDSVEISGDRITVAIATATPGVVGRVCAKVECHGDFR